MCGNSPHFRTIADKYTKVEAGTKKSCGYVLADLQNLFYFRPSQLSVGPRLGSIKIPKNSFFRIQIPMNPNPDLATSCEIGKFEFRRTVIKFHNFLSLLSTPFAEERMIICGVTFH
jgi:hypothetical protein